VLLATSCAAGQFWLASLVGINLLIASAFGTRLFLPGRAWPFVKRALHLGPAEPEHEYPPRFAQALGGIALAVGTLLFAVGLPVAGWVLVAGVAGLQTLLAATGYCLGCRLYFLRWWIPSLFTRLFRTNDRLIRLPVQPLRHV
jgi:hypothetical protein